MNEIYNLILNKKYDTSYKENVAKIKELILKEKYKNYVLPNMSRSSSCSNMHTH